MTRLAEDPHYFARPDRTLFHDIRRYFPITAQAKVAWAVREGISAAVAFIEVQLEAGLLDGGVSRCKATTRKGKACQRTPLPGRDYCPSHQHLETVDGHARRGRRLGTFTADAAKCQCKAPWHISRPAKCARDRLSVPCRTTPTS